MSAAEEGGNKLIFAAMRRMWRQKVRTATADAVWAGRAFSPYPSIAAAQGAA